MSLLDERGRRVGLRWIGAGLVLLSLSDLVGWLLDVEALKAVIPGLATMKPNTALCFLATGVALWLLGPADDPKAHRVARVLGAATLLLAGVTWLQYRLDTAWGVDELLLSAPAGMATGDAPMRMSEMTAITFCATGLALVMAPGARAWRVTLGMAIVVAFVAVTALVGYAYGVEALYAVDPFQSMALHTAAGFFALAAGLILTTHDRGLARLLGSESTGGTTARRMLAVALAGPFVLGLVLLAGIRADRFPVEFGTGLVSVVGMFVFASLVWWHGEWLDRAAREQRRLREQLLHAQKLEAVGRLAGGIAHDFNNVLSVVTATAGLLESEVREKAVRDDLRTIQDAADRATKLTRQLLTFGRQQVLRPRVVSLNEIIRGSDHILRRLVTEGVTLEIELEEELGATKVDPGQIELVLVNLVVNANDAMPEGGVVAIETRNAELDVSDPERQASVTPGDYVCLVVADDGQGMDAGTRANIFEPFFSTKSSGTGLGLATVHGIVEQSGGHIWVYSEPDVGTTFKVYLPRVDEEVSSADRKADVMAVRGGDETILVVDDEPAVREVVQRVLMGGGYSVLTASNGLEALTVIEEHHEPIDVVLTDVMMPELGGGELAARLAQTHPEIRTIFMSGYAGRAITDHGPLDEDKSWMEKPFTPTEILTTVREALDRDD